MINSISIDNNPIWPPNSNSNDFNGFSQKILEKIIRSDNLKDELQKYQYLLGVICNDNQSSQLFLHIVSKAILLKKKDNITGGTDIRVINVLPAWLIILEKLCVPKIKELLRPKIKMMQFGFTEGSDCNIAKIMIWINSQNEGLKKHLLIDVKKAFDSINRVKLLEMLKEDFKEEELGLFINILEIYNSIEIDMLDSKIYPTRGGPQGSSIVPLLFCYYLSKGINNLKLRNGVKIQAYADDLIIQGDSLEDLNQTYKDIKNELSKIDLVINPEKCEILSNEPNDKIVDDSNGIEIIARKEVVYLGQKINADGLAEELIEDKFFGCLKNKLQRASFLSRLTRIRIFKVFMVTKINHLLPLISLNGYLEPSWKCIRKIIFRDILKKQTSPRETAVPLGLGYYNLIVKPILKMIDREYKFTKNIEHTSFLKKAAKKALIFWKSFEKKLPSEIDEEITNMIQDKKWFEARELDKKIYGNMANRLIRNSGVNFEIKDVRCLSYPNYIYILSNAWCHETIDTLIQSEIIKDESKKQLNKNRALTLIKRICVINKIGKMILDNEQNLKISRDSHDIEEEMTIIELELNERIGKEIENTDYEANDILDHTILRIKKDMKNKQVQTGDLIKDCKLNDKQKEIRLLFSNASKEQAKLIDLGYELVEDAIINLTNKAKNPVGRPKKVTLENKNKKITDYMTNKIVIDSE